MLDTTLRIAVSNLSREKNRFLAELWERIYQKIRAKTPSECFEVVTLSPTGVRVRWKISDGQPFFSRFWRFLLRRKYTESNVVYTLDSGLTEELLEEITSSYQDFIKRHQSTVVDFIVSRLLVSSTVHDAIADGLKKRNTLANIGRSAARKAIKKMLLTALMEQLQQAGGHAGNHVAGEAGSIFTQSVSSAVVSNTATVAAKVAATSVGKIVISKFAVLIAKALAPVLAKLLAKPAVTVMLKKLVVVGIIGSMGKLIAAKLGLSVGIAVWIIVIPLIIFWVYKDYQNFPSKLGEALANAIAGDINRNFDVQFGAILENLALDFLGTTAARQFADCLLDDPYATEELSLALPILAATPLSRWREATVGYMARRSHTLRKPVFVVVVCLLVVGVSMFGILAIQSSAMTETRSSVSTERLDDERESNGAASANVIAGTNAAADEEKREGMVVTYPPSLNRFVKSSPNVLITPAVIEDLVPTAERTTGTVQNARSNVPTSETIAMVSISSAQVRRIQNLLRRLGYNPGQIDGLAGPQTAKAIMEFEGAHGMLETGVANVSLIATLEARWARIQRYGYEE